MCDTCNRNFYNDECYEHHLLMKTCTKHLRCIQCKSIYHTTGPKKQSPHICGTKFCPNCDKWFDPLNHECYIKKKQLPSVSPKGDNQYLFADFECSQHETREHKFMKKKVVNGVPVEDGGVTVHIQDDKRSSEIVRVHRVNYICTQYYDGVFWEDFTDIALWMKEVMNHNGSTIIFHNGKGYDFNFICEAAAQNGYEATLTQVGHKIMAMTVTQGYGAQKIAVKFIDSINFISGPLKSFTSTFGLQAMKGHFPHMLNRPEYYDYVGVVPDIKHFTMSSDSARTVHDVETWYKALPQDYVWDFAKERAAYCRDDVNLLRLGVKSFRETTMSISAAHLGAVTGVDPLKYKTLPSSAKAIYMTCHLPQGVMAALPKTTAKLCRKYMNGGRNETFTRWVELSDEEVARGDYISAVDVVSMYPFIQKTSRYPKGHPMIFKYNSVEGSTAETIDLWLHRPEHSFTLLCVDVSCPQDLLYPLLHTMHDGKLYFDLVDKIEARYTSAEVLRAISLGYKVTKVHEAIYWAETATDVFKDYVNGFLTEKINAESWPSDMSITPEVSSEEREVINMRREAYIEEYKRIDGIDITPASEKNSGKRAIAKLFLNSLWGKWAQQDNIEYLRAQILQRSKHTQRQIREAQRNRTTVSCTPLPNNAVLLVTKDLAKVLDEDNAASSTTTTTTWRNALDIVNDKNITVGIITTAYARLKLYDDVLTKVPPDCLVYCDTDSGYYIFRCKCQQKPCACPSYFKHGSHLGELNDDLRNADGSGKYKCTKLGKPINDPIIRWFASCGSKTMMYQVEDRCDKTRFHINTKVKGFSLANGDVDKQFDTLKMKNIMSGKCTPKDASTEFKFTNIRASTRKKFEVITAVMCKAFRSTFTKRREVMFSENHIGTRAWNNSTREEFRIVLEKIAQEDRQDNSKLIIKDNAKDNNAKDEQPSNEGGESTKESEYRIQQEAEGDEGDEADAEACQSDEEGTDVPE